MGREVRRVPKCWKHPTDDEGRYKPLMDGFSERLQQWTEGNTKWNEGCRSDFKGGWVPLDANEKLISYTEWDGHRPVQDEYMPEWDDCERTHLMMYEDTSEGTPISPAFETPEELARWLTDNDASAFGARTATYEQWLATCKSGWAPAMVIDGRGIHSGVAATFDLGIDERHPPLWLVLLAFGVLVAVVVAVVGMWR